MTQETKTAKYQDIYQLKNAPEPVRATLGHTEHQPAPVRLEGQPSVAVLPYVLQDFRDKAKVGLEKYGTRLRTNNGRDALADAYQEAVDKVMYLKQRLMEEDIEAGRDQLWQLDADLALDETWWTQQEELRQLKDRADFLEETHDLSEAKVAFYQAEAEKAGDDIRPCSNSCTGWPRTSTIRTRFCKPC
jgi:hypothetical protein